MLGLPEPLVPIFRYLEAEDFANEYDGDGRPITRKAKLVAKLGFTQIPGIDFYESYASAVRYESSRMNLA